MRRFGSFVLVSALLFTLSGTVWGQGTEVATRGPRFYSTTSAEPKPVDVRLVPVLRRRITLDLDGATLERALQEVGRQSGLRFVYSQDVIPVENRIEFQARNITVAAALTELLVDTGVDVVLSPGGQAMLTRQGEDGAVTRQQGSIVGRVTDGKTGDGLGGVDVSLEGTRWLATTAADGRYRLADVAPGSYTVLARRIGYGPERRAVTVTAAQETAVDVVALQPVATRLGDVVVTAQKREERLQNVPISISVLSAEELDQSTVRDVTEALSRVPGVAISESFLGGFSQVPVRGVATQLAFDTGASPTAYYLDGVPFGFTNDAISPDPDAYDLERVEVLRGPQGTLYGANALNGVVRVLTQEANPAAFEFKARTFGSTTELGGENFRGDLAVNVPLIAGKLAARAAVGYQNLSGWIDRPNNPDANDAERRTLRFKLNAQPNEQLSIGLSTWFSRADYSAMSTGTEDGQNALLRDEEPVAVDYDAYGLKIGYNFPGFSVTSMTSYLEYANEYHLGFGPTGLALSLDGILDANTFAQEVAVQSTHGGPWRWSVGGMYRDSEDRDIAFFPEFFGATSQTIRNVSKSYAVFGELTRSFLDGQVEVTAGLRYFEDDLTQKEDSRFTGEPPEQLIDTEGTFSATTPRFVLTWHPQEQLTVYGSYSEGFRSGFHQQPIVLTVAPFPPVEPDALTNYELGAKGSLFGRRLNFDAALYYIDWQDLQQSLLVEIVEDLSQIAGVNGESASGVGFEVALTAAPTDALELGVNFSWNDLSMDADVFSGGGVLFKKGDRPNQSAEYTAGVSAAYAFPLGGNGFEGRLSTSANYTSELEIATLNGRLGGNPMLIARASASIRAPARWTASLFVDNLNNERDSPVQINANPNRAIRVRPRTIGVQLEYRY